MRKFIPKWAKLVPEEAEKAFSGVIYDVYQWPQEMFDGSRQTFEMLRRADTVKILAVLTADEVKRLDGVQVSEGNEPKIVVTKQEQPRKDSFYDYPGGRTDAEDESELAAAKRELLEETGLRMRNWKLIKVEQPFSKIDWLVYTFLATGLEEQTEQHLDAGEKIEIEALNFYEVKELTKSNDARYMRFKELSERVRLDDIMDLPELYKY